MTTQILKKPAMPSAGGLSLIEQYHILSKALEQQTCDGLLGFDQEVPQSRHACDDAFDQTPVTIKPEPISQDDMSMQIFESLMACGNGSNDMLITNNTPVSSTINSSIINSGLSDSRISKSVPFGSSSSSSRNFSTSSSQQISSSSHNSSPFLTSVVDPSDSFFAPSSSTMTTDSSLPFSQPNFFSFPQSSSADCVLSLPTVITSPVSSTPTKVNSFVTELGGSGGTMTSFLNDQVPVETFNAEGADLMDLDKQPFSFYEELEPFRQLNQIKQETVQDQTGSLNLGSEMLAEADPSLEQAMLTMRNDFLRDSETLNIPFDPDSWTADHVMVWTSWVCRKYQVADISRQLYPMNGPDLCSHTSFAVCGDSMKKISEELEYWKAACSTFPTQQYQSASMLPLQKIQMNGYSCTQPIYSPCVSPAPSTGSNSQNSSMSGSSEDELTSSSSFADFKRDVKPVLKPSAVKVPGRPGPGRGHHKQTIHLWQFLRELLVSKDDHSDCIRWLDRHAGIFKIEDSKKVASLWGKRKNRPAMNYDKLSRSVRQYYKKGIIKKTEQSKRLVYQFCDAYL